MKRGFVICFVICAFVITSFFLIYDDRLEMLLPCEPKERLKGPLTWNHDQVLDTLLSKYILPPSSLPLNLTNLGDFVYAKHKSLFGWDFFDYYNRQFFSGQKGGFFIEAGALDGEFMSNSLWLEQSQGWSGLLIEADPVNFQYLVWKRRKAWISNTCISHKTYPREIIFESLMQKSMAFAPVWVYRANSRELNSYLSQLNEGFTRNSAAYYVTVQCFPLASYLLALNVTTVDYLSLDIQGHEWEVIKTLPMQDITFRVLAIEHFIETAVSEREGKKVDDKFIAYMKEINYRLIDIDVNPNYLFVLESDPLAQKHIRKFKNKEKNVEKLKNT